ncbi:MAG TPA: PfkB family carbohydrate kinase [Candidatus Competibacteraceae bacterium]|nr:PfkB family carbohydrate kinase [Candidatus Competibacteraceae bacterium]HRY17122.1 PfkB family carbohydrate kinase [Candidatus Competibacteraceae bacterium]
MGSVAQDDVVRLAEPLQPGAHLNGVLAGFRLGGGGANTAVALAAAGHTVILLAAVGRDAMGDALLVELAAAGVETRWITRLDQPTTHSLILIDPMGERTVVNVARCEDEALPEQLLAIPAEAVYVRSRRCDLGPLLAAKASSAWVVAHLPPLETNVRPAHILVASASDLEPNALQDPLTLGHRISGGQARWMVVTRGAAGASAWSKDAQWEMPAETVQPVDTTGAGDAFAAGLLHALVNDQPLTGALAMAVRFGTEATLWNTSGLPASAVQRLLR